MSRVLGRGEAVYALKRSAHSGRVGPERNRCAGEMQAVAGAPSLSANIVT